MNAKTRQLVLGGLSLAIVVTAIVRAWFSAHGLSIGLWGIELCDHGCRGIRWDNVPGAEDDLYFAGYVAVAAMLVGAAATLWFAIGNQGAARFARRVLMVAIVAMGYFILRGIALDGLGRVGIDWALVIGPAVTIAARQLLPKS
jgi:hypothetical protein